MSDDIYTKAHVSFDQFEIPLSLHCLRCNRVIAKRDETKSRTDPNVAVHAIVRTPLYREVYVELSDGSVSYFPFCSTCLHEPIDAERALEVVKQGWESDMVHARRPPEAIEALKKRIADLHVTKVGGYSHGW